MKKMNQTGFAAIEAVLILVVVAILGFTGWFVWHARQATNESLANTANSQPGIAGKKAASTDKKVTASDPTTDWTSYTSKEGKYTVKYPKTWATAQHPEYCNDALLLLGATSLTVGKCASEAFGQMGIDSVAGDNRETYKLSEGYANITEKSVIVDGVTGVRQSGSASGQMGEGGFGYADGTEVVKYLFFTNGRTYTATYVKYNPDVLSDFDLMATKTLKFE